MAEDLRISSGAFEGAFCNAMETVAEVPWSEYSIPEIPFIDLVFGMFILRTGVAPSIIDPAGAITKIGSRPVYLIHVLADPLVYSRHSKKLLEHFPQAKSCFLKTIAMYRTWQYDKD